jgi:16S rRNA processing protein RimM
VRGEVVVEPQSEVPGRLAPGRRLLIESSITGAPRDVEVVSVRPQGRLLLMALAGFESRDAAEMLRGALLEVEVDSIPEPPPGRFWIHQLIGCACEDRALGPLGTIADVISDGGGELLLVRDERRELLVPFVTVLVPEVDIASQRVVTTLPEGFLEACGSAS